MGFSSLKWFLKRVLGGMYRSLRLEGRKESGTLKDSLQGSISDLYEFRAYMVMGFYIRVWKGS